MCRSFHKSEALRVGAYLAGIQRAPYGFGEALPVAVECTNGRSFEYFACRDPFIFDCGNTAGKNRFRYDRCGNSKVQGALACPFSRALLAGLVQDDLHHRFACFRVDLREYVACYFDQVAVKLAFVPFCECFMKLLCRHPEDILQQEICFANQLHIAVFDPVVDHLHIMSGAVRPYICTARISVHLSGYGRKYGGNHVIGFPFASGHDGGTPQRPFLAAGNAGADEPVALGLQFPAPPDRVAVERVAGIYYDVALRNILLQLTDHVVHRVAGLDHYDDLPRGLQRIYEFLQAVRSADPSALYLIHHLIGLFPRPVVYRDRKTLALYVHRKVLAHYRKTDNSYILFFHGPITPSEPFYPVYIKYLFKIVRHRRCRLPNPFQQKIRPTDYASFNGNFRSSGCASVGRCRFLQRKYLISLCASIRKRRFCNSAGKVFKLPKMPRIRRPQAQRCR